MQNFSFLITVLYNTVLCAAGTFEWNRKCLPCPIGTYQTLSGQTQCEECGDTKVTVNTGAASQFHCVDPSMYSPCFHNSNFVH